MELDCLLWMLPVTLLGFFWPGCPCCESCEVFTDDFNRSNDTDLGADWTEDSGSWAIETNTLNTTSTSAVCTCDTAHPDASPNALVVVNCRGPTDCILRIILDYQDTSNYHFAQVPVGASKTFAIYKRSGGTDTLLASTTVTTTADTNFVFKACFQTDRFAASVGSIRLGKSTTAIGGSKVGVGTGATVGGAGARFDDFAFSESYDATDAPDCELCLGQCCLTPPLEWQVDLVPEEGTDEDCCQNFLAGTWIFPFIGEASGVCTWRLTPDLGVCGDAGIDGNVAEVRVYQNTTLGGGYRIHVQFGNVGLLYERWASTLATICTFDAQSLTYVNAAGCGGTCTVTALFP